jgi:hypothetical protein
VTLHLLNRDEKHINPRRHRTGGDKGKDGDILPEMDKHTQKTPFVSSILLEATAQTLRFQGFNPTVRVEVGDAAYTIVQVACALDVG